MNVCNTFLFVPGKSFQLSQMFEGSEPTLEGESLKGSSLGLVLALIPNNRLGWKVLSGANTLA
jgi:hypothetical protein